jgi:glycosyltransferase involved in cell wall biosynthesis
MKMTVSVILCSYNPDRFLLGQALDSLVHQTTQSFDVVVVDNSSQPPLDEAELRRRHALNLRVIREVRQGLTYARCAGIAQTASELIIFLDDDNRLDFDYVERAIAIAEAEPLIGHFGGIARAELPGEIPGWKRKLLPYLGVRNYGPDPITSREDRWGHWEPIGAGMVTRRNVACEFAALTAASAGSQRLGRKGSVLMSGEDSLMARMANRLGFACSYQPSLRLVHYIKPSRLRPQVLARTLEGHGRSYVLLERVLGRSIESPGVSWILWEMPLRLLYRIKNQGLFAGALEWFWDWGYLREARARTPE